MNNNDYTSSPAHQVGELPSDAELRKLAVAATPGPWTVHIDGTCSGAWPFINTTALDECDEPYTIAELPTSHVETEAARNSPGPVGTYTEMPHRFAEKEDGDVTLANAAYIAAVSPDTVLALLDRLKAADARAALAAPQPAQQGEIGLGLLRKAMNVQTAMPAGPLMALAATRIHNLSTTAPPPVSDSGAEDGDRLDWLAKAYREQHPHAPYYDAGYWRVPHLSSGAGGLGGGVGEATFPTLREAVDWARGLSADTAPVQASQAQPGESVDTPEFRKRLVALAVAPNGPEQDAARAWITNHLNNWRDKAVAEAVALITEDRDRQANMLVAACADLGLINEALDLDPDDGGAEPILGAIEDLKAAAQPVNADTERDAERFRWHCSGKHTESDALVDITYRQINGENPTLDEWRCAYDAAIAASKEGASHG